MHTERLGIVRVSRHPIVVTPAHRHDEIEDEVRAEVLRSVHDLVTVEIVSVEVLTREHDAGQNTAAAITLAGRGFHRGPLWSLASTPVTDRVDARAFHDSSSSASVESAR